MVPETYPNTSASRDELRALLARRTKSTAATLAILRGEAEVFEPVTGRWHEAVEGAVFATGQRVRVTTGRALVRLSDGSDVWLAAGAEIDLSAWSGTARALRLAAGRMLALVARAANPFTVATNCGEILVTGTAFEATASASALDVAVIHGSVEVAASNGKARARRGEGIRSSVAEGVVAAPFACDARRLSWIGDADSSLRNPRIAPAASALAETLQHGLTARKDEQMNARKFTTRVGGAAALLAGLWFAASQLGLLSALSGTPDIALTYIDSEGRTHRADGHDAAGVEALRKIMPKDSRDSLDEALARAKAENEMAKKYFGPAASTMGGNDIRISEQNEDPPEVTEMIERETKSATEAYRQMIKRGISPEEAKAKVAAAFADSLRAQQKARFPGDQSAVHVEAEIVEKDGQPTVSFVMTTRRWDRGPVPPGMTQEEFDALQRKNGEQDGISVGTGEKK